MQARKVKPANLSPERLEEALCGCRGCGWRRNVALLANSTPANPKVVVKCRAVKDGNEWHSPVSGPECSDKIRAIEGRKGKVPSPTS